MGCSASKGQAGGWRPGWRALRALKVKIPEGVTSIGENAFKGCTALREVQIPKSVTSIGDQAFYGCGALREVKIPEGVTSIGARAFSGCGALQEVKIPKSVTSIGAGAFSDCGALQEVKIPEGVTYIGGWAFYICGALREVQIPKSVTSIGVAAFYGCSALQEVQIPEGVTYIGAYAFDGCGALQEVKIPKSVTSIGVGAFKDCRALQEVKIPKSVTSIGENAFKGCGALQEVQIPEGVTSIGGWAFYGCRALQEVKIPKSVTSIGVAAFYGCSALARVITGRQWDETKLRCADIPRGSAMCISESARSEVQEFWFLTRENFLNLPDGQAPRQQTLKQRGLLVRRSISMYDVISGDLARNHACVSHRWLIDWHFDPEGHKMSRLKAILTKLTHIEYVWVDWLCAPQKHDDQGHDVGRSAEDKAEFDETLANILPFLYLGCTVIVLWDRQYNTRFWPNVESWTAMRLALPVGLASGGRRALFYDVLSAATEVDSKAEAYMKDAWDKKTAEEAVAELGRDDIHVTNLKDKVDNLKVVLELNGRVARCFA